MHQQLICPASDIHRDETIVFRDANGLELVHEMMGGDTSFESTSRIEQLQIFTSLEAYLAGNSSPSFDFGIDRILRGSRNDWLPDMHISVETDWSAFVENARQARDKAAEDFLPLYDAWARDKPTFEEALENELQSFSDSYMGRVFALC